MVECGFTSTETVDLSGTGAKDGHLDFHTAPGLCRRAEMRLVPNMSALHVGTLIIIIMYIYHALINALSSHMIHINLNMTLYTHVEYSPTKTIYIKYYLKKKI